MATTTDRETRLQQAPMHAPATHDAVAKPAATPTPDRGGLIAWWGVIGAIVVVVAAQAWIRWIASPTQFSPAPLHNADHYAMWRLVTLRVIEAVSAIVFVWLGNRTVVRPLRRERKLGIEGKIFVGCLVGCVTDGVLDMYQYLFAWNAHSINLGSWSGFLPFRSAAANPRYAEALVWGVPMYIYFCIGVAIAGCALIGWMRRRTPALSDARGLAAVFVAAFVFDFVVENLIIRLTQAYAFTKTTPGLTLFGGHAYQFPIYESVCVAALGTIFTALRMSAVQSPDGTSFVERGVQRFRPRLREPLRVLAVIGFAGLMLMFVYHIEINWLGVTGTSVAHLPSYLRP